MKAFIAILILAAMTVGAADVLFDLSFFTTESITRRRLTIQPAQIQTNGTSITTMDSYNLTTDSSGRTYASNVVSGLYFCTFKGPRQDTVFAIYVPNSNSVVEARWLVRPDDTLTGAILYSPGSGPILFDP